MISTREKKNFILQKKYCDPPEEIFKVLGKKCDP